MWFVCPSEVEHSHFGIVVRLSFCQHVLVDGYNFNFFFPIHPGHILLQIEPGVSICVL